MSAERHGSGTGLGRCDVLVVDDQLEHRRVDGGVAQFTRHPPTPWPDPVPTDVEYATCTGTSTGELHQLDGGSRIRRLGVRMRGNDRSEQERRVIEDGRHDDRAAVDVDERRGCLARRQLDEVGNRGSAHP